MTTLPFSELVKTGLLASGWYANRLERSSFPGVLALCYHGIRESPDDDGGIPFANLHVTAAIFAEQMEILAATCQPVDLAAVTAARGGGSPLPGRPVLITFDDGYRSVFEMARPVLLRLGIPATIFVCSEPVRRQRLFWFDAVTRARGAAAVAALRELPDEAWRQAAAEDDAPAGSEPRIAPMTEDHVRQLAADGFTIGVHTASHARLSGAPLAVQRAELVSCREALQSWTQQPIDAVAYPFGAPGLDYTADTLAMAASLGFTAGFTTRPDFNRPAEDPLERSRFVVLAAVTAAELAHRITYAWPR